MKCSRCTGKLALRIINATYYPINPEITHDRQRVDTWDIRWLVDTAEVYCTICGKVEENIEISYDSNGIPITVKWI